MNKIFLPSLTLCLLTTAAHAQEERPTVQEISYNIKGDKDTQNKGTARIEFCDNGPGIPADVIAKIWTQGFSTKQKKEDSIGAAGQGQGLFVCKNMIESVYNAPYECK